MKQRKANEMVDSNPLGSFRTLEKILFAGVLGGLALSHLVSACNSKPEIQLGRVVSKKYEPERLYTDRTFGLPQVGGNRLRHMIDDEDYIITFGTEDTNGKYQTRTVFVTKGIYDALKFGDEFDTQKMQYEDSDNDIEDTGFEQREQEAREKAERYEQYKRLKEEFEKGEQK